MATAWNLTPWSLGGCPTSGSPVAQSSLTRLHNLAPVAAPGSPAAAALSATGAGVQRPPNLGVVEGGHV